MATRKAPQIGLFASDDLDPPLAFDDEKRLAARLPGSIRLGTSSWTYPGWKGLVYPRAMSARDLVDEGLVHYCRHPLFRSLGVDRFFYDAPKQAEIDAMAENLPEDFPIVVKVWSAYTSPVTHGKEEPSARFLDPDAFAREMLVPFGRLLARTTFLFEFSPQSERHQIPAPDFAARLGEFLGALPGGPRYAVELRERRLFTRRYLRTLSEHGVAHVLNYWGRMPTVGEQLGAEGVLTAPFVVARLLLRPGTSYEELETSYAPFNRIVDVDEAMRADTAALAARCLDEGRELTVLVSNKVEGAGPLTVRALAERIAAVNEPR